MTLGETDQIEHEGTDVPVCPWCGVVFVSYDEMEDGEYDCEECGKALVLKHDQWTTFTTQKVESPEQDTSE
jgi:hypothetical protein